MITNPLYITAAEIGALKENKIIHGLLTEKELKVFCVVGRDNCKIYDGIVKSFIYSTESKFSFSQCYRIEPDYQLPKATESQIIEYLQDKEYQKTMYPQGWPVEVLQWAKSKQGVWEYWNNIYWAKCEDIFYEDFELSLCPHCLRADYGVKPEPVKETETEYEDLPVTDSSRGRFYEAVYKGFIWIFSTFMCHVLFIGFVYKDGTVSKVLTDASKVVAVRMRKEA